MGDIDLRGGNYAAELQDPSVYAERRRRLAEAVGEGTIVVRAAGDERGYGDVGTFRQAPDFFYLTGVELPNAVLTMRPQEGTDVLFLPERNLPLERWTGPKFGPGDATAAVLGFGEVLPLGSTETTVEARRRPVPGFPGRLAEWLAEPGAVLWTPLPPVPETADVSPDHRFVARLRERLPSFTVRDLSPEIADLRLIKDDGEVALMRRAIEGTMDAQRAAARTIGPGVAEKAVEGAVFAAMTAAGAEGLAFPSIVGGGFAATVLHYDHNSGSCDDGELVVVDIGARYGYYCGDLTRTYPVGGRFSSRQRELYDLVLSAHDAVAEAIRPGLTIGDLRKIAYDIFESSDLRDVNGERLGQHFIHGIGHFLGLEAHDSGGESPELKPGMVLTNEPGLYTPDESTGIRIENDFLVTKNGAENLSAELPTAADDIEAMMRA